MAANTRSRIVCRSGSDGSVVDSRECTARIGQSLFEQFQHRLPQILVDRIDEVTNHELNR